MGYLLMNFDIKNETINVPITLRSKSGIPACGVPSDHHSVVKAPILYRLPTNLR